MRVSPTRLPALATVWGATEAGLRRPRAGRPIFVVSLPRSGSSWVGALLGAGRGVQYLREPYTRTHVTRTGTESVFPFPADAPPRGYQLANRRIAAGSALFRPSVIAHARQWPPFARAPGRLVVKEVNPHACAWFIKKHDPLLVLLLRHPADIALSYRARGWWTPATDDPSQAWSVFGAELSAAWRAMHEQTRGRANVLTVRYEDLCRQPAAQIRKIYDWCGLPPDSGLSAQLADSDRERAADREDPYSLRRDSGGQIGKWQKKLAKQELEVLTEALDLEGLPPPYQYKLD